MKLRTLIFVGVAGFMAQPAWAQTAPTNVQATADSLLAAGYEIKAVTVLSDAAVKEVFPGQGPFASQVFVTFQKGTSVAVCENATANWISVADVAMTDATRCWKR